MGIIVTILIGALAGFLAGKIFKGAGFGFWVNLLVGIVGGFIGGNVLGWLGIHWGGTIVGQIVTAVIGAILLLFSLHNFQLKTPVVLGGYSLGGLFALWAACQTDRFEAVAAGSPSLWAGDWPQYAATHPMLAKHVYLSLGDREERSRNKTFARVGDRIRDEHLRLQQQLGERNTTLAWEEGGHFADPAARMARAFVWCLKQLA